MALPYDVVRAIEEAIPDRDRAERVIRALEEGLGAVREEAKAQKEVVNPGGPTRKRAFELAGIVGKAF